MRGVTGDSMEVYPVSHGYRVYGVGLGIGVVCVHSARRHPSTARPLGIRGALHTCYMIPGWSRKYM